MNNRIRELADQILPNEKEFHQGDPQKWGYFFSGEELEKFTLLIVEECAYIAKHHVMNISTYADAEFVEEKIKQHFGVE